MQSIWNVIRIGVLTSLTLTALAACQDSGFQSRKFSLAEQALHNAGEAAKQPPGNTADPSKGDPTKQQGQVIDPHAVGAGGPNYNDWTPGTDLISTNEKQTQLISRNAGDLNGAPNTDAANLYQTIDITIGNDPAKQPGVYTVAVDATVTLNGKNQMLSVPTTLFYAQDPKGKDAVNILPVNLSEVKSAWEFGDAKPAGKSVVGSVTCTDVSCTKFEVRFDYLATKPIPTVFLVHVDPNGQTVIDNTNFGAIPAGFAKTRESAKTPAPPTAAGSEAPAALRTLVDSNRAANPHDSNDKAQDASAVGNSPEAAAAAARLQTPPLGDSYSDGPKPKPAASPLGSNPSPARDPIDANFHPSGGPSAAELAAAYAKAHPPTATNSSGLTYNGNTISGPVPADPRAASAPAGLTYNGNTISGPVPADPRAASAPAGLTYNGNTISGPVPTAAPSTANAPGGVTYNGNTASGPLPSNL